MAHIQKVTPNGCDQCAPRRGVITHYELRWSELAFDPVTSVRKVYRQETFHNRRDALARKSEVEAERQKAGKVRDASVADVPFGVIAQEWLDSMLPRVANGRLKARTHAEYAALVRRYVLPAWAGVPIGAVTSRTAEAWARDLAGRGLGARTFRHAWSAFDRVLRYALRHDILTANPADRVDLSGRDLRAPDFEGRACTAEEVTAIAVEVQGQYPVYAVAVLFLAYTGLRAGELAGLNVGDLTLSGDAGAVRVTRTRRKVPGGWETSTPKSKASRRTVPLDSWLAKLRARQ